MGRRSWPWPWSRPSSSSFPPPSSATSTASTRRRAPSPSAPARCTRRLLIVDLHADSLLWGRDLLERGDRGHVDVPRMAEGNVAVQGFTVVTQTPRGPEHRPQRRPHRQRHPARPRAALAAAHVAQPARARALPGASGCADAAARSGGALTLIRTRGDLDAFLERRAGAPRLAAGFLGLEGAQALERRPRERWTSSSPPATA